MANNSGDGFLNNAYELESPEQTKQLYKEWAKTYDDELLSHGYASPRRTAEALAACANSVDDPVLDIGCGSGVSGMFLRDCGFSHLQGSDFSAEMLEQAERKQLYQALHLADFSTPFDFIDQPFKLMTAVGVFSIGHAGPDVLETVIDLIPRQGLFAFSLNDHALEEPGYMHVLHARLHRRELRFRWQEYGDHVAGIGLNSMIIVIEKLI